MEIFGQLLLMVTLAAGVQQTLAQNVSECAVLSTDLGIAGKITTNHTFAYVCMHT